MGIVDRIVRIILAIVLGVLYYKHLTTPTWDIVLLIIGIVLLLSALVAFCPLYRLFGIKTCKTAKPQ
jgi:Protein of unknown function (DUF2892).